MFGPGHNENAEPHVCPGLESPQPTPLDQVIAELAEPKAGLIVSKTRSGKGATMDVGITGRIGVAVFQAEIDDPPQEQGKQIYVRKECRRQGLVHNFHRGHGLGVAHQGQVDEFLDLAAS